MFAAVIGIIFILAGIALAAVSVFASGMDPNGRGMGETVGYVPIVGAGFLILLGLGLVFS